MRLLSEIGPYSRGLGALNNAGAAISTALERLASGRRLIRAGDDPSAVAPVNELKGRAAQIEREIARLDRENLRLGAQEGGLSVISDMLIQLDGLVTTAANRGAMSDDERHALQIEADGILRGINMVSVSTFHNGEQILAGSDAGSLGKTTRTGSDGEQRTFSLAELASSGALNLVDGDLELASEVVDSAAHGVALRRGAIGARTLQNESRARLMLEESEGVESARSLLEDADAAREMAMLVRGQILQKAAATTIQIGQTNAKNVLTLLAAAAR